ncbi:flagellar basal body protein [Hyphomicrobium sp.]|jgi:flagellar basal-body rod protein FlgB|uniref:flagellar basal body protein n=1 Tax=Hyphomicrobium sp. TaxID=82 RepID=UPI002B7F37A3|nr:flagellar basal body protein [Hyphomicrobium sp.]HVZ04377.1 flagellar basal body protein [Hyphomicrobium sp.]
MQPLQLFDLAFRQNEWLAQRQSVISANIANANTPGYKAKDVESFEDVMRRSVSMTTTNPEHIASSDDGQVPAYENDPNRAEVLVSGNDVSLEDEFLKSGEVMRSYSLNTQILKTFSSMLQSVTKG